MLLGADVGCCHVVEPEFGGRLFVAVEDLGSEVEAVGPNHRPRLGVHYDTSEVLGVPEGLEQRPVPLFGDVLDIADGAVVEEEPHYVRVEDGNADN